MSDETERENLAEAEQEVRYAVECGDEITVDRDTLRTVMAEYARRGRKLDEELGLLRELDAHYAKAEAVAAQGFAAALESVTSGELKRENADIRARIRALVERTSQGGET